LQNGLDALDSFFALALSLDQHVTLSRECV